MSDSCHSRDIGLVTYKKLLENESSRKRKEKWRPGGDGLVMAMEVMESEPPPVSIEDRTIVGTTDRGLNSTNHMPEVGGIETGKLSTICVPVAGLDTVFTSGASIQTHG